MASDARGRAGDWLPLLAVAAGYLVAFVAIRYAFPFNLESPWFVAVAMVCFLGLAAVARPVIPIRMPPSLREIRPWEAQGGFYRTLGVPAFGVLLRRTPLRLLNRDVYVQAGARDAAPLAAALEAAEASHFWDAVLVGAYMVRVSLQGDWRTLLWFSLGQLLLNVYPMMHLRLTRHRLDRLASRKRPEQRRGIR
jgi:hypothetical protein